MTWKIELFEDWEGEVEREFCKVLKTDIWGV